MIRLFKAGLIAALALYCITIGSAWKEWHAIYQPALIIHEMGHLVFIFFGQFINIAGGSIFQLLLPIAFASAAWSKGYRFMAAAITMTLGPSFFYMASYASDAIVMQLPLVGFGDATSHDWNYLLTEMGVLESTHFIAGLFVVLGYLSIVGGLVLGGIGFMRESQRESAWG